MDYEKEQAFLQKYMDQVMKELDEERRDSDDLSYSSEENEEFFLENDEEDQAPPEEENFDAGPSQCSDQTTSESDSEDQVVRNKMNKSYFIGKDLTTKWLTNSNLSVRTRTHNIIKEVPGPKGRAKNTKTEFECWSCFFTYDVLNILVDCTNTYIDSKKEKYKDPSKARHTDECEMKAFLGLLYLAGLYKSNRLNLDDLWQTDGTGIDIFRAVMCLQRFRFLLSCLRFDDITTRPNRKLEDKLAPIRMLFETIVVNCQANYVHTENVTIDEMLPAFRGRCQFRQYLPSKPSKYGIKIWTLADSKTYYVSNMEVYVGKQPAGPYEQNNSAYEVVKRLVTPIVGSKRNITMDNWFTSYPLSLDLLRNYSLTVVGTLRKNKREIPKNLVDTKNRLPYSSIFGFQKEATIVSYIPKKGKNVILLSTMHHDAAIDLNTGEKHKPEIITMYNSTKCGVDTVDQLCSLYNTARNSRRWPLTIFFTLLNVCGINAYVIFNHNSKKVLSRRVFLKKLALDLIKENLAQRENNLHLKRDVRGNIRRFMPEEANKNHPLQPNAAPKRCGDCPRKKDRKTKYCCQNCSKPICQEHIKALCSECSNNINFSN